MNRGTLLAREPEVQVAKRTREEDLLVTEDGWAMLCEDDENETVDDEPEQEGAENEDEF